MIWKSKEMAMYSWTLYNDDDLIEAFNGVILKDGVFFVNDDLSFDLNDLVIHRKSDDNIIFINLKKRSLTVKLLNEDAVLETSIFDSKIDQKNDEVVICYKVDNEGPLYNIIIKRSD